MTTCKIDRLCQSVLPPEFTRVRTQLAEIQHFFEQNLPEPLNKAVTVLTINPEEIVIAANSPLVVNHLRLHSAEIRQQLREAFKLEQTLRFRTIPDSLLHLQNSAHIGAPRQVTAESIEAIKRSAKWIEDEELRAALLSLADSLEGD